MTDTTTVNGVAPPAPAIPKFDLAVALYVEARDRLRALDDAHEKKRAPRVEQMNKLQGYILAALEASGSQSIKTAHGTCYVSQRSTASVSDAEAFMNYVITNSAWELIERRANATAVKDFLKDHAGSLPPGVNLSTVRSVGVRRA